MTQRNAINYHNCRILLTSLLLFLTLSCSKKNSDATLDGFDASAATPVTYNIAKGEHYATPNPIVFTDSSKLSFLVELDSSNIYYFSTDTIEQHSVNKIMGFSDCGTGHTENSARIGYRWYKGTLEMFGYVHNSGKIVATKITNGQIGKVMRCSIECVGNTYVFDVDGVTLSMSRHCSDNAISRYMLYPYFGGDSAAPHNIKVIVQQLSK